MSESSDDEIFFGPLTMKEIKKRLLPAKNRRTIGCISTQTKDDSERSIKIIETHSAPDVTNDTKMPSPKQSVSNPSLSLYDVGNNWDIEASDDSFLRMEKMVANMELTPNEPVLKGSINILDFANRPKNIESDIIKKPQITGMTDQLLSSNIPEKNKTYKVDKSKEDIVEFANRTSEDIDNNIITKPQITVTTDDLVTNNSLDKVKTQKLEEETEVFETPSKDLYSQHVMVTSPQLPTFVTPTKNINKPYISRIPHSLSTESNKILPVFKTPRNPMMQCKSVSSLKKTPSKSKAFEHIKSPIASYIKNSPQVPFVTDVRPKKPLGSSSIPKLVKTTTTKVFNKENVNLPALAYRNAKTTKVINLHTEQKLPQSVSKPKNIVTSLPKPLVMKHSHREMTLTRRVLMPNQQEDSFSDLSLHQADISVCIQKPAF